MPNTMTSSTPSAPFNERDAYEREQREGLAMVSTADPAPRCSRSLNVLYRRPVPASACSSSARPMRRIKPALTHVQPLLLFLPQLYDRSQACLRLLAMPQSSYPVIRSEKETMEVPTYITLLVVHSGPAAHFHPAGVAPCRAVLYWVSMKLSCSRLRRDGCKILL